MRSAAEIRFRLGQEAVNLRCWVSPPDLPHDFVEPPSPLPGLPDPAGVSARLLGSGIPASAILDVAQALAAPHTAHRSMIVGDGDYRALGIPIKLSRTPGAVRSRPKELGADTREVCQSAGLEDAEIDEMVAGGIIFESQHPNSIAANEP